MKADLADWLKDVNRGKAPALEEMNFTGPPTNDVLGQTLQLLHAVYVAEDGLRISELAKRFSLDEDHVRLIMDRLVALEPMAGSTDGTGAFPAHVLKECDDWDDEANDDSTYRADFSDLPEGADEPSPFMWRDLFELNIALREASRVYHDPAILSAIEKIEGATSSYVQVEMATNETMLADVSDAVEDHQQIKILYTAATADEARTSFDRTARDQGPQRPHLRAGLLHDPRIVANVPGRPDQRRRRQLRRHRGASAGHRRQLAHPGR